MLKKIVMLLISLSITGCADEFYYNKGKKIELSHIKTLRGQQMGTDIKDVTYYKTSSGHVLGVTDEILVECKRDVNCTKVLHGYGLKEIKALNKFIYLVKTADRENIFKLSQKLYEDNNISKAHPNFIQTRKRR